MLYRQLLALSMCISFASIWEWLDTLECGDYSLLRPVVIGTIMAAPTLVVIAIRVARGRRAQAAEAQRQRAEAEIAEAQRAAVRALSVKRAG